MNPFPKNIGERGEGEGRNHPPPRARIGLGMGQSKKFCFGIFMTLTPKNGQIAFQCKFQNWGDDLNFAL